MSKLFAPEFENLPQVTLAIFWCHIKKLLKDVDWIVFILCRFFKRQEKSAQQGFNFVWFYMNKVSKEVCIGKHEKKQIFRYQNDVYLS